MRIFPSQKIEAMRREISSVLAAVLLPHSCDCCLLPAQIHHLLAVHFYRCSKTIIGVTNCGVAQVSIFGPFWGVVFFRKLSLLYGDLQRHLFLTIRRSKGFQMVRESIVGPFWLVLKATIPESPSSKYDDVTARDRSDSSASSPTSSADLSAWLFNIHVLYQIDFCMRLLLRACPSAERWRILFVSFGRSGRQDGLRSLIPFLFLFHSSSATP